MNAAVAKMFKKWDEKFKEIEQKDKAAKQNNMLVGRYIRMPVADGYAFYEIVRENKQTVRIEHITGLGDDKERFRPGKHRFQGQAGGSLS